MNLFKFAFLALLAVLAGPALATPASFDTAGIIADLGVYVAAAVLLIGTFIAGLWTKRALSLAKPG